MLKGPLGSKGWVKIGLWAPEPLDAAWKDFRDHLVQSCFPEGETEVEETWDFLLLVRWGTLSALKPLNTVATTICFYRLCSDSSTPLWPHEMSPTTTQLSGMQGLYVYSCIPKTQQHAWPRVVCNTCFEFVCLFVLKHLFARYSRRFLWILSQKIICWKLLL